MKGEDNDLKNTAGALGFSQTEETEEQLADVAKKIDSRRRDGEPS